MTGTNNSKIAEYMEKYRDLIPYAVFGVLTTLVNIASYWLFAHPMGIPTVPASVMAWIASVTFAFLTNRKWVFRSTAVGATEIAQEAVAFFASRLATGVVDWAGMWILVDLVALPDVPVKVILNIIVIVLNYLASKLIVFKDRHADENQKDDGDKNR